MLLTRYLDVLKLNVHAIRCLSTLIVERQRNAYKIILNRPEKLNAINGDMFDAFKNALRAANDDGETSITVVSANGAYFSAGVDITPSRKTQSPTTGPTRNRAEEFVAELIRHEKPLCALVNGPVYGVMTTTLGLYDIVLASDKAIFVTPFGRLGIVAEGCSTTNFPALMGHLKRFATFRFHAAEMLLFDRHLSAEEAYKRNLVNEVIAAERFEEVTAQRILEYSQMPVQTMRIAKRTLQGDARVQLLLDRSSEELALGRDFRRRPTCVAEIEKILSKNKRK